MKNIFRIIITFLLFFVFSSAHALEKMPLQNQNSSLMIIEANACENSIEDTKNNQTNLFLVSKNERNLQFSNLKNNQNFLNGDIINRNKKNYSLCNIESKNNYLSFLKSPKFAIKNAIYARAP